jgi:hypothetical protein
LKRSRVVLLINVLIIVSVIAGAAVVGLIVLTGVSSVSTFSIGTPTTSTSGGTTIVSVPVTIGDNGYFGYSDINVNVAVSDSAGDNILTGRVGPFSVASGETNTVQASLVFDSSQLSSSVLQSLATTPQNLTVGATIGGSMPPFIGVSGGVSAQLQWGAPVSDLVEGTPTFAQHNSTTIEATVPVSFTNDNSFLTVSGSFVGTIYNSTSGAQVGSGTFSVDAAPGTTFSGSPVFYVDVPTSTFNSLFFKDATLHYMVKVSSQSSGLSFSLNQQVDASWGAPVKSLSFGAFSTGLYNGTHSTFSVPFSFTDNSAFLGLSENMGGTIYDASGNVVGSISPSSASATPGEMVSGTLTGFVQTSAVGEGSYVLHLTVTTSYGVATTEVTVSG